MSAVENNGSHEIKLLAKDDVFEKDDSSFVCVEVPEWNGWVRIKNLSGAQRESFEVYAMNIDKPGANKKLNIRAKLIVMSAVDANGNKLFKNTDVESLSGRNAAALSRVYEAALKLNGIGQKDIEDAAKN